MSTTFVQQVQNKVLVPFQLNLKQIVKSNRRPPEGFNEVKALPQTSSAVTVVQGLLCRFLL